jgi:hypothetical protein
VEERQTDAAPAAGDPGSWGVLTDLTQLADAARHDLRASLEAGDAPNLVVNLPASCLQSSQAAQTLRVKISYSAGGGSHTTQEGGVRNPLAAACATHGDFAFFWVRALADSCRALYHTTLVDTNTPPLASLCLLRAMSAL